VLWNNYLGDNPTLKELTVEISEVNVRLESLAWTRCNGAKSGGSVRILPSAGSESQVIGTYERFAADAQRFEVVSQYGQMSIRPWLPATSDLAISSFGSIDRDEEQALKAA